MAVASSGCPSQCPAFRTASKLSRGFVFNNREAAGTLIPAAGARDVRGRRQDVSYETRGRER